MFDLGDLTLTFCFFGVLAYFWRAQGTRELALRATRKHLDQQQLQLLDGHVALRAVWCKRDANGQIKLWRRYIFEFTATGHERYKGQVVTLGNRIEGFELEPHRFPNDIIH
ncbi:MAG: DUF3301 domain-containing protein [Zhongshania sp.]|uniref:DUF3301 domain-containing protein n=1 Tax=Zhongshania sp. TaxID=1971902 RepID=UPI00262E7C64|nr:DUF3301 domain-containing protein [Zhongshania sp.]MDF1693184.1 DUF3301 domain-containing protein [Zhongshania sp.]